VGLAVWKLRLRPFFSCLVTGYGYGYVTVTVRRGYVVTLRYGGL
jgi:hypothetical protein